MLEISVMNLFEDLQKFQTDIIKDLKTHNDDKEKCKEFDKKLDAVALFINAIIKFRRVI